MDVAVTFQISSRLSSGADSSTYTTKIRNPKSQYCLEEVEEVREEEEKEEDEEDEEKKEVMEEQNHYHIRQESPKECRRWQKPKENHFFLLQNSIVCHTLKKVSPILANLGIHSLTRSCQSTR